MSLKIEEHFSFEILQRFDDAFKRWLLIGIWIPTASNDRPKFGWISFGNVLQKNPEERPKFPEIYTLAASEAYMVLTGDPGTKRRVSEFCIIYIEILELR